MKYVLIIGDGMADDPLAELGGKTPLEACRKPFFDSLCERGELGLCQTIPEGFPPGSDTAIMGIFGCDPRKYSSGRAPLELAASGGVMPEGGAAYRCNMVNLGGPEGAPFEERIMISHSAGSIEGEESDELVTWLFAQPDFAALAERAQLTVRPGSSFRHLAVQERADIAGIVLAPPHDHLNEKIGPLLPSGCANAEVLLGSCARPPSSCRATPSTKSARLRASCPPTASGSGPRARARPCRTSRRASERTARRLGRAALPRIARLVGLEP